MNTKQKGNITEAKLLARFLELGEIVLLPFGDNERYDMVLERSGKFVRVQCKTGRLINGAVKFQTHSSYGHRGRSPKPYTMDEIDMFACYCPQLGTMYLIPVEANSNTSSISLRIDPSKNGQITGVRLAVDYQL